MYFGVLDELFTLDLNKKTYHTHKLTRTRPPLTPPPQQRTMCAQCLNGKRQKHDDDVVVVVTHIITTHNVVVSERARESRVCRYDVVCERAV